MLEHAKSIPERGAYLDVIAFDKAAGNYQPTNTPAISLLYALDAQLARIEAEGGIEQRWQRHDAMRRVVEEWVGGRGRELGFSYLPREGRRSWTVSCLEVPEGRNGRELVQAVKKRGWIIGTGYGELKPTTLRIGHMGDHSPERVGEVLGVVEEVAA
jgi:aspartate aminotransferase-like enzyme